MTVTILANSVGGVGMPDAVASVSAGQPALDVVEAGIRPVERDPSVRSVGIGGWANLLGEVELDASIMDGRTLRSGAVGALAGFPHAISVARLVMERLPHVLLAGDGAARFAGECGAETEPVLTDEARAEWRAWLERHVPASTLSRWPDVPLAEWSRLTADPETAGGTTTFLVKDTHGDIAAGVSTCGWAFKYPGRLGDSPLVGAGVYADNRYGAAGCTGMGELAIRAGTARAVVLYMKMGMTVDEACGEALEDLRSLHRAHRGGLVVHAMDADGVTCVRSIGLDRSVHCWRWREGTGEAERAVIETEDW